MRVLDPVNDMDFGLIIAKLFGISLMHSEIGRQPGWEGGGGGLQNSEQYFVRVYCTGNKAISSLKFQLFFCELLREEC